MLLNLKVLLVSLTCGMAFSAQAESVLKAGNYRLVSGDKGLCLNFSISKSDAAAKNLVLGGLYSFEVGNSNHVIESDLDPECVFKEQNERIDEGEETKLTRINEEVCKGKTVSRTVSTAMFGNGAIKLRHEIQPEVAYSCEWNN